MHSAQTGNDVRVERLIEWLRDSHAMEAQAESMLDKSYSGFKDLGGKMMAMGQAMGGMMVNDEIVKGAQMGYVFENLEIASYEILIAAAKAIGDTETADVCTRILAEEVAMAEWMRSHLAELTQAYLTRAQTPHTEAKR